MAQNVTIAGASYSDVPSIVVQKTGGGTAVFADPSVVTAVAADVAQGKYFLDASGTLVEGTSSGGGGGVSLVDFLNSKTTTIDSLVDDTVTYLFNYAMYNGRIKHIFLSALLSGQGSGYWFSANTALLDLVLPEFNNIFRNYGASGCTKLTAVDLGKPTDIYGNAFNGDTALNTLIIRRTSSVCALNNINAFTNTPFASGKAGGTLYVPSALFASYQSATNWSTILGYTNNQIKSIESTHTDPNAPIDLTLYYADGTPIT